MTTEWKDITDPEELFRLKREGWEIQRLNTAKPNLWADWDGYSWVSTWNFRARPRQPKMKMVKLLAYLTSNGLTYIKEDRLEHANSQWIRQPHLDLEGEVPDDN